MRSKARPLRIVAKRKLQDTHPRKSKLLPQPFHLRGNHAQIFRHKRQLQQLALHRLKKLRSRTLHPAAFLCRARAGGHFPERLEAAKVVQPHQVEQLERSANPLDPPAMPRRRRYIPAVKWIAPKLSGDAEVIRRNSGNYCGARVLVQSEQFGMRPNIRAVMRHVNRNIPHHANTQTFAARLEQLPLAVKLVLGELMHIHLEPKFFSPLLYRMIFSSANAWLPIRPHRIVKLGFAGHEQRIVLQPRRMLPAKRMERRALLPPAIGRECASRLAQESGLKPDDPSIIDALCRANASGRQVLRNQQPLPA